jgi:hypothetical protein
LQTPGALLKPLHRLIVVHRIGHQIRTRLADVRVTEPLLNPVEWHAVVEPSGTRLTPQIVEMEIDRAARRGSRVSVLLCAVFGLCRPL